VCRQCRPASTMPDSEDIQVERTYSHIYDGLDWKVLFGGGAAEDAAPASNGRKGRADPEDDGQGEVAELGDPGYSAEIAAAKAVAKARRANTLMEMPTTRTWNSEEEVPAEAVLPTNEVRHRANSTLETAGDRSWKQAGVQPLPQSQAPAYGRSGSIELQGDRSWKVNGEAPSQSEAQARQRANSTLDNAGDRSWQGAQSNGQRPPYARGTSIADVAGDRSWNSNGVANPADAEARQRANSTMDSAGDRSWQGVPPQQGQRPPYARGQSYADTAGERGWSTNGVVPYDDAEADQVLRVGDKLPSSWRSRCLADKARRRANSALDSAGDRSWQGGHDVQRPPYARGATTADVPGDRSWNNAALAADGAEARRRAQSMMESATERTWQGGHPSDPQSWQRNNSAGLPDDGAWAVNGRAYPPHANSCEARARANSALEGPTDRTWQGEQRTRTPTPGLNHTADGQMPGFEQETAAARVWPGRAGMGPPPPCNAARVQTAASHGSGVPGHDDGRQAAVCVATSPTAASSQSSGFGSPVSRRVSAPSSGCPSQAPLTTPQSALLVNGGADAVFRRVSVPTSSEAMAAQMQDLRQMPVASTVPGRAVDPSQAYAGPAQAMPALTTGYAPSTSSTRPSNHNDFGLSDTTCPGVLATASQQPPPATTRPARMSRVPAPCQLSPPPSQRGSGVVPVSREVTTNIVPCSQVQVPEHESQGTRLAEAATLALPYAADFGLDVPHQLPQPPPAQGAPPAVLKPSLSMLSDVPPQPLQRMTETCTDSSIDSATVAMATRQSIATSCGTTMVASNAGHQSSNNIMRAVDNIEPLESVQEVSTQTGNDDMSRHEVDEDSKAASPSPVLQERRLLTEPQESVSRRASGNMPPGRRGNGQARGVGSSASWRRSSAGPGSRSEHYRNAGGVQRGRHADRTPPFSFEVESSTHAADTSSELGREPSVGTDCSSARIDQRLAMNHEELLAKPIEQWDEEDVACWVSSFSAVRESITDAILANAINGQVLMSLSEADVGNLEIEKFGHRRILMIAARKLRKLHLAQRNGGAASSLTSAVMRTPSAPPLSMSMSDIRETREPTALAWAATESQASSSGPVGGAPPPQVRASRQGVGPCSARPQVMKVATATSDDLLLPGSPTQRHRAPIQEAIPGAGIPPREHIPVARPSIAPSSSRTSLRIAAGSPPAVGETITRRPIVTRMSDIPTVAPSRGPRVVRAPSQHSTAGSMQIYPDGARSPHLSPRSMSGTLRPVAPQPRIAPSSVTWVGSTTTMSASASQTQKVLRQSAETRVRTLQETPSDRMRDLRRQFAMEAIPGRTMNPSTAASSSHGPGSPRLAPRRQ